MNGGVSTHIQFGGFVETLGNSLNTDYLKTAGFVHTHLAGVSSDTLDGDWQGFAASWSNLRPDTYMADGGKYRYRRYSEFSVEGTTGTAELLPHVAYMQEKTVNHLNGGIDRMYEPFEGGVVKSSSLASVFGTASQYLEAVRPGRIWKAQCFQNRILTSQNEVGQPAPEGMHRDGVDYVLTLFVDRVGADGGESSVYLSSDRSMLASTQLSEPGEYLFVDDHKLLHDVTGLSLKAGHDQGYRDVLIAMFTATSA
jgi:hypothetical protein